MTTNDTHFESGDSGSVRATSHSPQSDSEESTDCKSGAPGGDESGLSFFVTRFIGLCLMGAIVAAAWLLPDQKPIGVFGRLSYAQFMTALVLTLLFCSVLIVVIIPKTMTKAAAFRFGAIWLVLSLSIVICETVSGLISGRALERNPWYLGVHEGTTSSGRLPYERPPYLHWEGMSYGDTMLAGENDPEQRPLTFRTDFQGFRNNTDITTADIVFIGDSYTEAGNVPETESYVQKTAQKLNIVARNLGRAGYSTREELIVLEQYGLPCEPQVVVWQVAEVNDLQEALFPTVIPAERPPTSFTVNWHANSPSLRLFSTFRTVNWPLRGRYYNRDGESRIVRFLILPDRHHRALGHPGWPVIANSIEAGARALKQRNIELVVVLIPMKFRVLKSHVEFSREAVQILTGRPRIPKTETIAELLRQECQRLDITFIDPTARLEQAAASGALGYLQYDTHLSPAGHEVVSDVIASALRMRWEGAANP